MGSSMSPATFGVCIGVAGFASLIFIFALILFTFWICTARTRRKKIPADEEMGPNITDLQRQMQDAQKQHVDAHTKMQGELREAHWQLNNETQERRRLEINLENTQGRNKDLMSQNRQLENTRMEAEVQRDNAVRKGQALTKELSQMQQLLAGRTEELRGAQKFLNLTDQFAVADVTRQVKRLNEEIMQLATSMADVLVVQRPPNGLSNERSEVVERVERMLGVTLTALLRQAEDHLSILIQTAFQTSMVSYARNIVSSWSTPDAVEVEDMLNSIYARVRTTELQPVAARWKQLTRGTLQRIQDKQPDLLTGLVAELGDILVAAGHHEDPEKLEQRIRKQFALRLDAILKFAQDLKMKVGEGFMSCDLELLYDNPDTVFDDVVMEDAFPSGGTLPNNHLKEKILCTTDLGLEQSKNTNNGRESTVLLKAKVVLPSVLE